MAGMYRRNGTYYAKFYQGKKPKRVSLQTDSYQIAKAKVRQIEQALHQGEPSPLPTKTPLDRALTAYVEHIRAAKTPGSAQKDACLLQQIFGPVCDALKTNSRTPGRIATRGPKSGQKPRTRKTPPIEAKNIEDVTAAQITAFITASVRDRGLSPRSANRFREILCRLFSWSMRQNGVKMPSDRNPAQACQRYAQKAPEIRFLTLPQIDEQLAALADDSQLQAMVALYIYAGLHREEALWLTLEDIDLAAGTYGMIRVRAKTVNEQFWQPKTKVNRVVPISSSLRARLDRYAPRPSIGAWYFPSPTGHHYDIDNFSHHLAAGNARAGLPWTCLDYRHTFGSQLAMKGESLYKISKLMGNSPDICRIHYAALTPETLTDSVEFSPTAQPPAKSGMGA